MVADDHAGEWLAVWDNQVGGGMETTSGSSTAPPQFTSTSSDQLPGAAPGELLEALRPIGPVSYLPNPSLWDSLVTAIMSMGTRPIMARYCIRDFSAAHGRFCNSPAGRQFTFPDPGMVLRLDDSGFTAADIIRFHPALKAAATVFLAEHHDAWLNHKGAEMADALQSILHVGPWTAQTAAADYTGDLSLRPVDLALQKSASRIVPALAQYRPKEFERLWNSWCHTSLEQHALTLYVLAWSAP